MRTYKEWCGDGDFKRFQIPLVRRIYPQLIADKLISVQPLTAPTGLTYYLHYKHARPRLRMKTYEQWAKEQDV